MHGLDANLNDKLLLCVSNGPDLEGDGLNGPDLKGDGQEQTNWWVQLLALRAQVESLTSACNELLYGNLTRTEQLDDAQTTTKQLQGCNAQLTKQLGDAQAITEWLTKQLRDARNQNAQLTKQLRETEQLQRRNVQLTKQFRDAQDQNEQLTEQLGDAQDQNAQLTKQLGDAQDENAQLTKEPGDARAACEAQGRRKASPSCTRCKFFETGRCRRGNRCTYLHVGDWQTSSES